MGEFWGMLPNGADGWSAAVVGGIMAVHLMRLKRLNKKMNMLDDHEN